MPPSPRPPWTTGATSSPAQRRDIAIAKLCDRLRDLVDLLILELEEEE
jgi:hypothetical protein